MAEIEIPNIRELEQIKERKFTKRVALVTAMFAVMLAITSLGGNNAMKEMLLAAQEASNQWTYYQAKVIREHLYRAQKASLEIQFLEKKSSMKPEARAQFEALLGKAGEEEARYAAEKKDVEREARKAEHEREINRSKDPYFDYAEVLLQIGIVMATISIIASSRPIFYFALVSAGLGTVLSINGFFLLFRLPFFH